MKWVRFARRVSAVLWPYARPYVPAYDPLVRRRVRGAARRLVTLDRWPGKEATSKDAAQLSVLRSLDLQRLTRTSSRLKQHEAAALLARASVETTIVGIWCMCDGSGVEAMQSDNAYSVERLMLPLLGSIFLPPDAVKTAVGKLGTPRRFFIGVPLESIKRADGPRAAQRPYDIYYGPLSSFFARGTGMSLMRHTKW